VNKDYYKNRLFGHPGHVAEHPSVIMIIYSTPLPIHLIASVAFSPPSAACSSDATVRLLQIIISVSIEIAQTWRFLAKDAVGINRQNGAG